MQTNSTPASSPRSTPPAPVRAGQRPVHEIQAALDHMTPQSRSFIDRLGEDVLAYRLGKGTVAGALNDTVRLRIVGDGPMSSRRLVADSPAAQAVLDSRAGARLLRILQAPLVELDGHEKGQELSMLVLPKDSDAVMAHKWLAAAEAGHLDGILKVSSMAQAGDKPSVARSLRNDVRSYRTELNGNYAMGLGAWNQGNAIIFSPQQARSMLTAAGAYRPHENDAWFVRSATVGAHDVNHIPNHEYQHSATPVSGSFYSTPGKWLEEAVAETLSKTPEVLERTARATGVNRHSYAGHMAHEPEHDLGWKPFSPKPPPADVVAENRKRVERNYTRSDEVLGKLLEVAGYGFGSTAEIDRTRDFLQERPAQELSDVMAQALVRTWKLDPDRTKELSTRIASVIDDEGGVPKLFEDFGIG